MDSSSNIYCKIELIKKGIHSLHLNIHLNPDAPNIKNGQTSITWSPTGEELDFLNDALSLIDQHKKNKHITFSTRSQNDAVKETIESQIDNKLEQNNNKYFQKRNKINDPTNESIEQIIS